MRSTPGSPHSGTFISGCGPLSDASEAALRAGTGPQKWVTEDRIDLADVVVLLLDLRWSLIVSRNCQTTPHLH